MRSPRRVFGLCLRLRPGRNKNVEIVSQQPLEVTVWDLCNGDCDIDGAGTGSQDPSDGDHAMVRAEPPAWNDSRIPPHPDSGGMDTTRSKPYGLSAQIRSGKF